MVKSEGFDINIILPSSTDVIKFTKKVKNFLPTGSKVVVNITNQTLNNNNKDIQHD